MLNINALTNTVADNIIAINGIEVGKLTDDQATQLISIIKGFMSGSTPKSESGSTPKSELHIPAEKSESAPVQGEKIWQDDDVTVSLVDGVYRLYIETRVPKVRYAIKSSSKGTYGVKFAGNAKTNNFFWCFPDKDSAELFILDRKERAEKKEKA